MFRTLMTTGSQKRAVFRSFTKAAEPVCCISAYTAERGKSKVETITLPNGTEGEVQGGSSTGILKLSSTDAHNGIHELFHNFIHNHQNASEANKTIIDPKDQESGHKKAGGIFIYENQNTGTKKENLNQKNVNEAVNTLPEKK